MGAILDWLWGSSDSKYKGGHGRKPGTHKGTRKSVAAQQRRNAPRIVASVPAPFGAWIGDRRQANTRAQLASRPVRNTYGARGERHNPVQRAAKQYSHWWGNR